MSDDLTFDISESLDLAAAFENAPAEVDKAARVAMAKSLAVFLEAVVVRSPNVFGFLEGSIAADVFGTPAGGDFLGTVTHAMAYGDVVEFGRKKKKRPPVEPLFLWAKRKFSLSDEDARNVAWGLAENLSKREIPGQFMFKRGFEASEKTVAKIWDGLMADIVELL